MNLYRPVLTINSLSLTIEGFDTVESLSVEVSGFTKTRAFPAKSCQNISSSVRFLKIRAFPTKSGQNISKAISK